MLSSIWEVLEEALFNPITLPMLGLLSSKEQGCKDFRNPPKPCHVGIHWIALTEYSQMSTHIPGFRSFFSFFGSFCIGIISPQQHKGWCLLRPNEAFKAKAWLEKIFEGEMFIAILHSTLIEILCKIILANFESFFKSIIDPDNKFKLSMYGLTQQIQQYPVKYFSKYSFGIEAYFYVSDHFQAPNVDRIMCMVPIWFVRYATIFKLMECRSF